jgi:uncharacterized protein (TIGR02266 family)
MTDERGLVRDSVILERRQSERLEIAVEITLSSEHQFFSGLTGDISRGGVFVCTYRDVPIGSTVDMTFVLPTGSAHATGVVRWTRPGGKDLRPGIGITFGDLSEADRGVVEAFCAMRAPLLVENADERLSEA